MTDRLAKLVFGHRSWVIAIFLTITGFMGYSATRLTIDAGFSKLLPLKHEYMRTFTQYRQEFGGANRVLIAITVRDGDIFTPSFFHVLKKITDEVFFIPGVDRTQIYSLFTPNVRFTEVVEDGIVGGNVIPDDFHATREDLERVRKNILKSGYVGRLVANDFSGAIVSAQLLERNPHSGERLDYVHVADQLEQIRTRYNSDVDLQFDYHVVGFAKVIGDITLGAKRVVLFFGVAFFVTAAIVYVYAQSFIVAIIPLFCSLIAVIWQLGLLPLLGFGIDPMSILVPFLVFAIGVSHGVQMVSAFGSELFRRASCFEAAEASFRRLLVPGGIALVSDTIGFVTILLIEIEIVQEMAVTASLGVGLIILTNFFLLPVLTSYLPMDGRYRQKLTERSQRMKPLWVRLAVVSRRGPAALTAVTAVGLLAIGLWKATDVRIGDPHRGVPELHGDSQYNIDTEVITEKFSIGVDVISVIAETVPDGCIDYDIMSTIDRFEWHMRNVEGVQSVLALSTGAKIINAGWNEGSLKWRVLPRNQSMLVQAVSYVDTGSGLLNADCSVMPILIFTTDHKAQTIATIVAAVKEFRDAHGEDGIRFRLATGNVGVMAATNEVVEAAQFPILLYVFLAVITLCLITFRSLLGTACIVIPLALVSLLAYALMALLEIGLKVNTLPVVALGVGIGVDYGIYVYSRLESLLDEGRPLLQAYLYTLAIVGYGVICTGITLGIGVATWIFSPLKFQADMGILLTFMFLMNMVGAILLLPALANFLLPTSRKASAEGALGPVSVMSETTDVVDENNKIVGSKSRAEVHREGLRHRAAHNALAPKGKTQPTE